MVEFYHYLFYRASSYYKDKDFPVYSPVILISFIICLNYVTVFDTVYYWVYIVISLLLFAVEFYITTENVFRLYPDHFTLPNNIHFISK